MRAIIATFAAPESAESFARSMRVRLDLDVSTATIGATGEPFDGHRLVVAWVPEDQAGLACDLAIEGGGVIHDPATGASPAP